MRSCSRAFAWCAASMNSHLFNNLSPFHYPVKEKEKQSSMKGLTMAQWINLNRNNGSVLANRFPSSWEKTGPLLPPLVGLTAGWLAGWLAGWQTIHGWIRNFKKSLQGKLFGFLPRLISMQCYYSIVVHFSRLFSSKAYSIACLEVRKIRLHFIFMSIPTIRY